MNKKVIYFLRNLETLIMVCKILILLLFLVSYSFKSQGDIVYKKNNTIISSIDLETYKKLYKENYGQMLDNNNALKNLVLINNLIKSLESNNKEFLNQIDNRILNDYRGISFDNQITKNFFRFLKIRNEFTINYFQNELNVKELEIIFDELENLNLPVSKNDCLILEQLVDLKNNRYFIEDFFNNLKTNTNNFTVLINDELYRVCIDQKKFRSIEQLIINYIQIKTKDEFEYFVYGKSKN